MPKDDDQQEECNHIGQWENDEMFGCGAIVMLTNDNPEKKLSEEMRQFCKKCGKVRYVPKLSATDQEKLK